jgi:Rieske Fe-S protein
VNPADESLRPRRAVLRILATGVGATLAGVSMARCTGQPSVPEGTPPPPSGPPGPPIARPLSAYPIGQRVTVDFGDHPVEVLRSEAGVTARSLLCSHFGCRVTFRADDERYHCACHKGLFDVDGRPVGGPVIKPLMDVPARLQGDQVVVGV